MKLEVRNLKKSFGEKEVLHGMSFSVKSGSALGLLGRNGAGKTTTIRILMDVFKATEGSVLLDGKPFAPREYQIGYLPEERGLYPKKTVSEQLIYMGMLRGLSQKTAKESTERWLEKMQKVQLAQTLVCEPDIIILDEPFSGLDPVNSQILKDVIREQIEKGKLVIFSSHQMSYVEEFCEEIAILNHGEVVLGGDLKEIKREFGKDRLVLSSLEEAPETLARRLSDTMYHLLEVEKVQRDRVIIREKEPGRKKEILEGILAQDVDLEYFGLYEPSLNDIFVEKAGDEA